MTQYDLEIVLRKIKDLKQYLDQLETVSQISQADYEKRFIEKLAIERLLHLLIETAIDINTHLIVSSGQAPPETYYDSFLDVGKIGAISDDLASS